MSGLFEPTMEGVRIRLAETDETRSLLDEDLIPPLGATPDLDETLRDAGRGTVLDIQSLMDVKNAAQTLRQVARFIIRHAERSPHLSNWGLQIEEEIELEQEIDSAIDSDGEIRDSASSILADARSAARRLSGDLQKRLERYLSDRDITEHLSDLYFTLRNDRYVLPVRSDAKGRVPGIVHDASRSGATLFIEPEAVVDLNNRLKQTELEITREIQRILRDLSRKVGEAGPRIRRSLDALGWIDLAFARGRLSQELQGHSPRVEDQGIFELRALRHPLIAPDECVANDIHLGEEFSVLVLSGPNAGGKTVCMKAVALACLFVRAGLHVPCEAGSRVDLADGVIAEIGDHQDIGENLSTFSAHMANLADIVRRAGRNTLVVLDEIGVGTDPGEGSALAQAILERLAESGARVVTTTHYNLLKEMADIDPRFQNASVEFDAETLAPSYRVKIGTPGSSSASAVAARMGMPSDVLERADSLLSRDDRQLDRMLSELSTRRAALEAEQETAARLRAEGEATRTEYRKKLESLQERRDKLFHSMRHDLDQAFQRAHGEVADVIRELQRGPSSQQAAEARSRLLDLEDAAESAREEAGVSHPEDRRADLLPIDWRQVVPGDPVELALGGQGVVESLPDRKGRVAVRVGGKKLMLPAEQLGAIRSPPTPQPEALARDRISVERALPSETEGTLGGGRVECDLRGERVAAALLQLREVLDRAAADGRDGVRIIHGIGTGALRSAVREELALSDYVTQIRPATEEEGGEGVTLAELRTGRL
ncbi:MAG: Smr/MutS family protein [Myxococcota bacterium]